MNFYLYDTVFFHLLSEELYSLLELIYLHIDSLPTNCCLLWFAKR